MRFFATALTLLTISITGLSAAQDTTDDPWRVLPDTGAFADREIMLLKHLGRIAQPIAWQREVELARIRTESDWEAYRERVLRDYERCLSWPLAERREVRPERTRVLDRGGYRIENLVYESVEGVYVTANLYVPQDREGPFPGILVPCGHSENGKAYELYHSVGLGLVKKGYVVLVYDPPGQGERYQYLDESGEKILPSPTREHSMMANPLFLMGEHLMALRIHEAMLGIDYLRGRPDVDPERIGVTGNSGGGTVTLHLTPLDSRIKVAVPVGTVSSPDMELGTGGIGDGEQNLTMLVPRRITHADLMMLAWPRPYMLIKESLGGVHRHSRQSWVQARWLYETLGAGERMAWVETERPHGYYHEMREPMYGWFGRWLQGRDDDSSEPALEPEKEEDLLCTKSGQIILEKGRAVWQWAADRLGRQPLLGRHPDRETFGGFRDKVLRDAETLLNNPGSDSPLRVVRLGSMERGPVVVEKLAVYSEDDIYLPGLLFRPAGAEGKLPALLLADSDGMAGSGIPGLAARLAATGCAVLAVDTRGTGETRIGKRSDRDRQGGYEAQLLGVEAGVAYDGLKLGRSIFAMRVFDLRRAVRCLAGREDVDPERIAVAGRKGMGMAALYAGALEAGVRGVLTDSSLVSFSELVNSKLYTWHFMDFLPGVLKHQDLQWVGGTLGQRSLAVINSLDAEKRLLSEEEARKAWSWTGNCFRSMGNDEGFTLEGYATGRERETLYTRWLRETLGI